MGQKTHPYGFRLSVIRTWSSKWYEDKHYAQAGSTRTSKLRERSARSSRTRASPASQIERAANKAKVVIPPRARA